jgi:hypothetical protein
VHSESTGACFFGHPGRLALLKTDIAATAVAKRQAADLTSKDVMVRFPVERSGQNVRFGIGGGRVPTPQS